MADIKQAVANFDLGYLMPPVHDGHPKPDATSHARGFIKSVEIKADGKLWGNVCVDDAVKHDFDSGNLHAHSLEFYRDLDGKGYAIRGLGLLGATPPRQKGLGPLFSEDFEDERGKWAAVIFSETPDDGGLEMAEPGTQPTPPKAAGLTQEQLNAVIEAARAEERAKALKEVEDTSEFAEIQEDNKNLKVELAERQKKLEILEATTRKAEIATFAEELEKENKLTPHKRDLAAAIVEFVEPLLAKDDIKIVVFADGGDKQEFDIRSALKTLTKSDGDSIRGTHGKAVTGDAAAEKIKATGDVSWESFAEHDPTPENMDKAIVSYTEAHEGKSASDAIIHFSETDGEWVAKSDPSIKD